MEENMNQELDTPISKKKKKELETPKMGCQAALYKAFIILVSLFIFILHEVNCSVSTSLTSLEPICSMEESSFLLQFKNSLSIKKQPSTCTNPYAKTLAWKEGTNCCSWLGVSCNNLTGHVIGLDLSCSWLRGTISSNSSLFQLPYLQSLNLAFNDFEDSQIVPEFGQLVSLTHLNLSLTSFSGEVPFEFSYLSKLVSLDLSRNYLLRIEGSTMENLVQNLTELRELFLDEVDLSTAYPSSFNNLSLSLTSLSLDDCGLKGDFPTNVFSRPNLQILILAEYLGGLTAHFPESNWNSPLEVLVMSGTSFTGPLPESIGNLKSLRTLDLRNCNFTGPLPTSLGNLTLLAHLTAPGNSFEGQIPESISNLVFLQVIDLSRNKLSGQIPNVFLNSQLCSLDFSDNQLTGPIPSQAGELPSLTYIFLQLNSLNGTIPSWLFTLPSLVQLDLSFNQLSGRVDEFESPSPNLSYIDLSSNNLDGPIPSSLFQLTNLTGVTLSSNTLITELAMFTNLKRLSDLDLSHNIVSLESVEEAIWPSIFSLRLSSCNISGELPVFLMNLHTSLQVLDLSNNSIYGGIPNWIGNFSWTFLDLSYNLLEGPLFVPPLYIKYSIFSVSNNKLSGTVPLTLCNYNYFKRLDLSGNNFSGEIPPCLASFSYLSDLNLKMNNFHGSFSATCGGGNMLRSLNLNGNQLEGSIPHSFVNCQDLQVLDLGNNKMNGIFPFWLQSLPNLKVLVLRSNLFEGPIPEFKSESVFPSLQVLDLSNNEFTGNLPSSLFANLNSMRSASTEPTPHYIGDDYFQDSVTLTVKGREVLITNILETFTAIDLSENMFQGDIPGIVGDLISVLALNLSHNSLSGVIPETLGNMKSVESLDLSFNNLDGVIPQQMTDLTFLAILNLSHNQLVGAIPQGRQFDTFQNDSYYGNLQLCGAPLSMKCNSNEPTPSGPSQEDDSDVANKFDWKASLLGYGCGTIVGVAVGHIVLSTRRPGWLIRVLGRLQHSMHTILNGRHGRRR